MEGVWMSVSDGEAERSSLSIRSGFSGVRSH